MDRREDMKKENLIKARELIIDALNNSNMNIIDKTELMINLNLLFDPTQYEDNIQVLKRKKAK